MSAEDRCINTPSWSLPMSMILEVATVSEECERTQSSILKEALEDWFEKHRAMNDDEDRLQYDKK